MDGWNKQKWTFFLLMSASFSLWFFGLDKDSIGQQSKYLSCTVCKIFLSHPTTVRHSHYNISRWNRSSNCILSVLYCLVQLVPIDIATLAFITLMPVQMLVLLLCVEADADNDKCIILNDSLCSVNNVIELCNLCEDKQTVPDQRPPLWK